MTRTPVIAGNWKMHLTRRKSSSLARDVAAHQGDATNRKCIVFPTFVHLDHVRRNLKNSNVILGAQNCWPKKEGAFTGEISPYMLRDMGAQVVLLGHSERRHVIGEEDAFIAEKVKLVLRAKLEVMLCVGETLEEREANRTFEVLARQLKSLKMVKPGQEGRVSVAYEPVWAIGTGKTATPEMAQAAHAEARSQIEGILGAEAATQMPILYGGSVKAGNAAELLSQPDVDGALVGGASLSIEQFGPILDAAPSA
ncbi:MAG TPA: triose-phosphate isomerase [Planctomycetota bacterium]|mgnify:CR=1 FL=1|jgi:triosephosphate isomerase|nr:triose-phosphate isomerase [Planctomycetota bacterium]MDP7246082.1 triose-phosphate isomerase [Planctomycetota bacterium]HJM38747.1 triose-phosphate isomerase [Planctomycetota bacterium]|tara:strand:+ start:333 stop:1094 length:762 start_codon:yes stop_codon:yes gene_type:complete